MNFITNGKICVTLVYWDCQKQSIDWIDLISLFAWFTIVDQLFPWI